MCTDISEYALIALKLCIYLNKSIQKNINLIYQILYKFYRGKEVIYGIDQKLWNTISCTVCAFYKSNRQNYFFTVDLDVITCPLVVNVYCFYYRKSCISILQVVSQVCTVLYVRGNKMCACIRCVKVYYILADIQYFPFITAIFLPFQFFFFFFCKLRSHTFCILKKLLSIV